MNSDFLTPDNDAAMRRLFDFVNEWRLQHSIDAVQEIRYLSQLLAGRIDVMAGLAKIKAMSPLYEDE